MGSNGPDTPLPAAPDTPSRHTLARSDSRSHVQSHLSYIWATNPSLFSRDVDRWIGGDTSPGYAILGGQARQSGSGSHAGFAPPPLASSRFWYVAAMVLPLINLNYRNWRCTPSALLNTAELMFTQMAGYCSRVRSRFRRMAHEHGARGARDLFAGAMDVVLVVYAIGFLLLSLYQASVFQQF